MCKENSVEFTGRTYHLPSIVLYARETMMHELLYLTLRRSESSEQIISRLRGQHYNRAEALGLWKH